jgi:anti-sigma factor RsiW
MNERDLTPAESGVLILDEAESLIWALLDDQLEAAETKRLAQLLEEHEVVRRRYLECVQLHVDLHDYFARSHERVQQPTTSSAPILPNLMSGGMSGMPTPVSE